LATAYGRSDRTNSNFCSISGSSKYFTLKCKFFRT